MAAPSEEVENAASAEKDGFLSLKAKDCAYTSCYCEENVWKLCEHAKAVCPENLHRCHAVFVSNERRAFPLWKQKNASTEGQPVFWDYHVFAMWQEASGCWVLDLDSRLPFPCSVEQYIREALLSEHFIRDDFHRWFRVVSAQQYLQHFASDRSHMRKADGTWLAEPPEYPPISTPESSHNIDKWISMNESEGWGTVMDLRAFCAQFSSSEDLFDTLHLLQLRRSQQQL